LSILQTNVMKFLIATIITAITITLTSSKCTKEKESGSYQDSLTGRWIWIQSDGGIANNIHETPASTGKNIELQLTNDGHYFFYFNGVIQTEGTYAIGNEKSIIDHSDKPVIDFSTDKDLLILRIDSDNLILSDNAYDGIGYVYKKISRSGN
jgi:hypothetical protein